MEFTCFPKLPTELRLAIWRLCIPNRTMELHYHPDNLTQQTLARRANWKISANNRAPPLITQVCHEARSVAFESGRICKDGDAGRFDFGHYKILDAWHDTLRDSVHLNLGPFVDLDLGDPLRSLLIHVAHTKSKQASIMLALLHTMQFREDPAEQHKHYRWTRSQLADLMRTKDCWTVVVLSPVIVHTDVVTGCQLFGLLGDARVQIVHADDEARLQEYMEFEQNPNVTFRGRFTPADLLDAKNELRAMVESIFGSEEEAPVMRPAVMFRLCVGCKECV